MYIYLLLIKYAKKKKKQTKNTKDIELTLNF